MLKHFFELKRNLVGLALSVLFLPAVYLSTQCGMFDGTFYSDPANGQTSKTAIETTYAGTIQEYDFNLQMVEKRYGAEAKALYVEGLRTGDLVPFRTKINDFKSPIDLWVKSDVGSTNPGFSLAEFILSDTKTWMGPYATAQDFISWASGKGYNVFDVSGRNKLNADLALNKSSRPAEITKAQYQKNHGSVAAAPAASNNQVESLKSYKGNNAEFNAFNYYSRYPDLQAAIGANGDALLKHYNEHGKAEGRNASSPVN